MRRTALLAVTSTLFSAALLAQPIAAAADATVALPLTGFHDIVVDDAHGHVFLTGGSNDGVVVTDLDGAVVTTVPNEPGAWQMALSDDGSTLFVALSEGDAVSAISTTTLTETARYSTGASTCPEGVAVTSGKVWFGYGCYGQYGSLGSIDPSVDGGDVATGLISPVLTSRDGFGLQGSPALPGVLVGAVRGLSPATLLLIDVTGPAPVVAASSQPGSWLWDWSLTADGADLLTAFTSPTAFPSFSTTDLGAGRVYGSGVHYPVAVATSGTGLVAGGRDAYSPTVTIYDVDGSTVRTFDWSTPGVSGPDDSDQLFLDSLAFTADASRLYAVTHAADGGAIRLRIAADPGKDIPSIALVASPEATAGSSFSLTGTVSSPRDAVPPGTLIKVDRQGPDGAQQLPDVATGADGQFTIDDTVLEHGTYEYDVSWAGDSQHASATQTVEQLVAAATPTVVVSAAPGPYAYGETAAVSVHLGGTASGSVALYAQPYGAAAPTLLKAGVLGQGDVLTASTTLLRNTVFTAHFDGDETYDAGDGSLGVRTRARVVDSLSGGYATSGSYRLFRAGVHPTFTVSVAPSNPGGEVHVDLQKYAAGTWTTLAPVPVKYLDSTSRKTLVITSSLPIGTRFRLRATFVGNARNAPGAGSWVYGQVTS